MLLATTDQAGAQPFGLQQEVNQVATEGPTFTESRSIGQLTSQVLDNLALLVEKQVDLAKLEAKETLNQGLNVLKMFGPALVFALLFVIALIVLIINVIAIFLHPALAALIVTLVFLVITGVLAYIGYRRLKKMLENPMGNTVVSLQEDIEWAKRQLRLE